MSNNRYGQKKARITIISGSSVTNHQLSALRKKQNIAG